MKGPGIDIGKAYFRAAGLRAEQIEAFRSVLGDLSLDSRHRDENGNFILLIELSTVDVCDAVRRALFLCPLSVSYGVWMSLVTEHDSYGMALEPYVCDFYRHIGGRLDFSFTVLD